MSIKHSIAGKKRWSGISPEEKTKRMSDISHARWDKIGKRKRTQIALALVEAKKQKHATK